MVPTYIVLCSVTGFFYIFDPNGTLSVAPVYKTQREMLSLWMWGSVMWGLALMMLGAMIIHNRWVFAYALCCCALTWLLWGGAFALSAATTNNVTWLAPSLPVFVVVACIASTASLLSKEV